MITVEETKKGDLIFECECGLIHRLSKNEEGEIKVRTTYTEKKEKVEEKTEIKEQKTKEKEDGTETKKTSDRKSGKFFTWE